jgi:IS4 transposase
MHIYKHTRSRDIFKLLDKDMVIRAVNNNGSDRYSKGFSTWDHLIGLLFCQFSGCRSLRDLVIRFNANSQSHYRLRCGALKRSTLSDANKNRCNEVFRDIANQLIRDQNQEIKDVVSLIDSSLIRIDGRGSEWTEATETRCGKGVKLHIKCGSNSKAIEDVSITGTNVNDITEAQNLLLEEGKIYVFDKGYMDFNWWHKIDLSKAYFVTRIKKNSRYKVIQERTLEGCSEKIVRDFVIELTNTHPRGGKKNLLAGKALRLIEVYDPEHQKTYQFISNLMDERADRISDYYKERWGIELLFKWLKQNLKMKVFLSENENAIKTQIYIAIIAYVLIGMLKKLYGGAFDRAIDLLSWLKVSILSARTPLRPPNKKQNLLNTSNLYSTFSL